VAHSTLVRNSLSAHLGTDPPARDPAACAPTAWPVWFTGAVRCRWLSRGHV